MDVDGQGVERLENKTIFKNVICVSPLIRSGKVGKQALRLFYGILLIFAIRICFTFFPFLSNERPFLAY